VTGSFSFSGPQMNIQGPGVSISSWSVSGSSTVSLANGISSGTLDVSSGGQLSLTGGPSDKRLFDKITGSGKVICNGGNNAFNTIAANSLQAIGGVVMVQNGVLGSLSVQGGDFNGGKVTSNAVILASGFVRGGVQLSASNFDLQGTINIEGDGTTLTFTSMGVVSKQSLLTMSGGSSIVINSGATLNQNAPLSVVPGGMQSKAPAITINGLVASTSSLSLATVPVSGTGTYTLSETASWSLNNIMFQAKSLFSKGQMQVLAGSFNVQSITGSGTFTGNPNSFTVSQFAGKSFTLASGATAINNCTLESLTLQNGVWGIVELARINSFNWQGGSFQGTGKTQVPVTVKDTAITTTAGQKLTNIALTTNTYALTCGSQACQFFSQDSSVRTVGSK